MDAICFVDDLPEEAEWLKCGSMVLILRSLPTIRIVEIIEKCLTG